MQLTFIDIEYHVSACKLTEQLDLKVTIAKLRTLPPLPAPAASLQRSDFTEIETAQQASLTRIPVA